MGAPAICPVFDAMVCDIADKILPCRWELTENAPATLEYITEFWRAHGTLLIWGGGSERTIYGHPQVNHRFRAWHDWTHIAHRFPLTVDGEHRAYLAQRDLLRTLYGPGPITDMVCRVLAAEVTGQLGHQACFGEFPKNQRQFVLAYLAGDDWRDGGPY